jgi:hypothetical protein
LLVPTITLGAIRVQELSGQTRNADLQQAFRFAPQVMRFQSWAAAGLLALSQLGQVAGAALPGHELAERHSNGKIAPKFFIVSMVS